MKGERYNKLVAIRSINRIFWEFKCDCGATKKIRKYDVILGKTTSCGCHKSYVTAKRNKETATMGRLSHTPTGVSWRGMMTRCYNKNNHTYAAYGAAGIKVCEFLRATPENLVLLIGARPNGKTLDRTNNLSGYHCGQCAECLTNNWLLNVKWSTPTEQGRNQRTNHLVTINGVTRCLSEWGELTGLGGDIIRGRISRGWSGERLIMQRVK